MGEAKPSLYPCKHCNGTTFCSASRDPTGKLKTRPACVVCLAKAGLDPKGLFDKVLCSVCRGTGMVEPASEPEKPRKGVDRMLLIAIPAVLLALVFFAFSALSYYRDRSKSGSGVEQLTEDTSTINLSVDEARDQVQNGMTPDEVKRALGDPHIIRSTSETQESWVYRCKDGRLLITFLNGRVYGRQ